MELNEIQIFTDPQVAIAASVLAEQDFLRRLSHVGYTLLPSTCAKWWPLAKQEVNLSGQSQQGRSLYDL